ncbi:hypothetical protein BDF21DRAFT_462969 [Thamnidium elegans]|nr:hypothetical protein BDF21DRAFT_462969 [Thamnidium elegans]
MKYLKTLNLHAKNRSYTPTRRKPNLKKQGYEALKFITTPRFSFIPTSKDLFQKRVYRQQELYRDVSPNFLPDTVRIRNDATKSASVFKTIVLNHGFC